MMQKQFSYLFLSDASKVKILCDYAVQDDFLKPIIQKFYDYKTHIKFSYFENTARYNPKIIKINTPYSDYDNTKRFAHSDITISKLSGLSHNLHFFIHEMIHFYQDISGIMFTPIIQKNAVTQILSVNSEIILLLYCEAMAVTEAIKISYRLREKSVPFAWQGVLNSPDWYNIAHGYADNVVKYGYEQAEKHCFTDFFQHKNRKFYEQQAIKMHDYFKKNIQNYDIIDIKLSDYFMNNQAVPTYFHNIGDKILTNMGV